ncbi:MinD-like ATPase involved in chromosome partitioning or flagellar assembly [Thermoanaerobacter thermohydrosulfuricus]|uniref:MinD-like ATPase involved in chromosome partitioning or flagellar assembly n=1 Tax=Thermoanaerobacter thermohydrosulfuricus TaxID=1516 RepID=A0A1G7HQX5_THETY|nr:AAA family ATPase [Thermoanaerobacter thermohydrosulfuricus]SDF02708.1 MinD-like ATPase involved in chromosome partitioning or flagellar assembly [Thermoanaerobacter thermohydrosulfuricus]
MIVSIFSPKGGVGKTTIALALSKTAARKLKVCTVEFDFSPGDFVSILDLDRKKNILEAVNGNIDWAVQRPIKQNFDVIVGGYPDTYEMIKPDKFKKMMEELNNRYELVIVDIQPAFVEGCIDIFDMSKDILFIVEDNPSVNSRAIGNIDWARANGFIDLKKVKMIVNKVQKKELVYVNITELKLPVIYKVPYIKNLGGFENPKMLKHTENILNILYPDVFHEERRGFLFFMKKQAEQIPAELLNAERTLEEPELLPAAENITELESEKYSQYKTSEEPEIENISGTNIEKTQKRIHEERSEFYPMKVYVNTGYKELDDIFRSKFETADSLAGCDAAIISYISNKDYIRSLISAGKKIILLAGDSDYSLVETAKEIGIRDIYYSPIDPGEIIDNLINTEGGKNDMEEKTELEKESAAAEQNQPEVFEISQKQESESEIDAILGEIKNILARNKEIYERRISMQEETIKQKEEEIKELQKMIEEYREKEEKRKKVFMELQELLQ